MRDFSAKPMPVASSTTKQKPLVSVVTPSYNQAHFIEKTIRSVVYQDYPNLEYFVLDAMSKDGTDAILDKYSSKITRAIRERDDGQADAINKGFQLCSGEIMAYLNSDDCYASPYVVSKVVEHFAQHPNVDVIYGKREYIDEKGFFLQNYPFRSFSKDDLVEACFIPQECVFWRKSIYEKAGNKVDKEFSFAMDYDLWLRFLEAGAEFLSVDEYYGLFRWYPGQKSRDVWIKHGLPEIAKLQEKHLGHALPEDEMIARYQQHWYGVNRLENAKTFTQSVRVWNLFASNKKQLLSDIPRDQWVFMNHLEAGMALPSAESAESAEAIVKGTKNEKSAVAVLSGKAIRANVVDPYLTFSKLVEKTGLFDAAYYQSQVQEPLAEPLKHFFTIGCAAGFKPHALFDTSFYLEQNEDVRTSGVNALMHWLSQGASEGRNPHRLFDTNYYVKNNHDVLLTKRNPLEHFLEIGGKRGSSPHLLFDADYYLERYSSELSGGINPLQHYLTAGAFQCNPHPLFDTAFFLARYKHLRSLQITPLEYFIEFGAKDKLDPHGDLLYESYALTQPGIKTSGLNVLEHYLSKGRYRPKFNSTTPVADLVETELNMQERGDELFRVLRERSIYVLREHYFRPMVNPAKLPDSHWTQESEMVGIDINIDACIGNYEQEDNHFIQEFRSLYPIAKPTEDYQGFYLLNGMYMAVDAHIYWSTVRKLRPRTIIEIGAGNSTMLAAAALKLNAREGSQLVVIEPYPDQIVKAGLTGYAKVEEKFVEDVDLSFFDVLQEGDILFIDSTHVLRQGGDVQHIYCEILPRVPAGVYVHVHDISLPKSYPRTYLEQGLFWTEQYMLQAYLSHNKKVQVVWPGNFLLSKSYERMMNLFPEINDMRAVYPSSEPSSFWFKTL